MISFIEHCTGCGSSTIYAIDTEKFNMVRGSIYFDGIYGSQFYIVCMGEERYEFLSLEDAKAFMMDKLTKQQDPPIILTGQLTTVVEPYSTGHPPYFIEPSKTSDPLPETTVITYGETTYSIDTTIPRDFKVKNNI